jgi:two-component system, LuxR family, sensor kinase FixL
VIRDEPEARKSLRRRVGDRRRAVLVGGSVATFIVLGGIHSPLVDAGVVETPYMISFAFLTFVLALSYELVSDAVLATRYAKEIRASETHWRSLLTKVQLAVISIDPKGRITSQLRRSSTPWYLS